MSHHVPEFEVALAAADYKKIDELWLSLIDEYPGESGLFLSLAAKLADHKELRRASSLLGLVAASLKEQGEYSKAYDLVLQVAVYHSSEKGLWDQLMELIPQVFAEFPEIDSLLATGREHYEGQVRPFLEYLDTYTHFRPGDFVNHGAGWGVGRVVAVNPTEGKLSVDFETKKDHRFALTAARRMIVKLPNDHFDVWKISRLEDLRALCASDAVEAVKLLLKSDGRAMSQRDVKMRFVPEIIEQKVWSRVLTRFKKAASQDPYVRIGAGANPMFELLEHAVTFEETIVEKMKRPLPWEEKLEISRHGILETETHKGDPQFLVQLAGTWQEALGADATDGEYTEPRALAGACWINECRESFPDLDIPEPAAYAQWYRDPESFIACIAHIPVANYQRALFNAAQEFASDAWPEILTAAFLSEVAALWDEALKHCDAEGRLELFNAIGDQLTAVPEQYPGPFIWYVRQFFLRAGDDEAHLNERVRLVEKLFGLGNHLQHFVDRGEKHYKDWITKLKAALVEKRTNMLGVLIDRLSMDRLAHVYHAIGRCRALGENLTGRLRTLIVRVYPEIDVAKTVEPELIDSEFMHVTAAGLNAQQAVYDKLLRDDLPDIQKAIGEALAMGDVSENAELDAAREAERLLTHRIAEIEESLKRVKLIDPESVDTSSVGLGTRVTYRNVETDERTTYTILGPWDSDPDRGVISYLTKIAESLLGKAVGDSATIAPVNEPYIVEILEIEDGMAELEPAELGSATSDV